MKTAFVLPVLSFAISTSVFADVTLPSVLSPGMVLQRDKPVPVWGQAAAGEKIKVTFAGQTRETSASAEGKWLVRLDPLAANATGQTLTVQGNNKIELADVLIGEVWLGSGQSNMEWPVSQSENGAAAVAAARFPQIRLFQVPKVVNLDPQPTCDASWKVCSPENAAGFSAVLYFMGAELHRELGVPVGLINSSAPMMAVFTGSVIDNSYTRSRSFCVMPSRRQMARAHSTSVSVHRPSALTWPISMPRFLQAANRSSLPRSMHGVVPQTCTWNRPMGAMLYIV